MVTAKAQHFGGLHTSPLFTPSSPSTSNLLINSFTPHTWETGTDFHYHIILNAWEWNTNNSFILTPAEKLLQIPRYSAVGFIQTLPALFLSFLFLTVSVNHSVSCHGIFLQHTESYNHKLINMLGGKPPETVNVSNYEVKAALLSYLLLYYTLNSLKCASLQLDFEIQ